MRWGFTATAGGITGWRRCAGARNGSRESCGGGRPAGGGFCRLYAALSGAYRRQETDARVRQTEAADYYTMWVHQIKTPIAAMKLLLQAQTDGGNDAVQAELFKIEQYAEMVLQYQRLEGGGTDYVLERCPLDDILCQAVRKYARLFVLKRLQLHYEPLNVTVLTDEKWLGFVIEQLLSNALKYTKSGGISLYMRDPGASGDRGYRHRHRAGGPAAAVRARLYRRQRAIRQKGDRAGAVSVPPDPAQPVPHHHPRIDRSGRGQG